MLCFFALANSTRETPTEPFSDARNPQRLSELKYLLVFILHLHRGILSTVKVSQYLTGLFPGSRNPQSLLRTQIFPCFHGFASSFWHTPRREATSDHDRALCWSYKLAISPKNSYTYTPVCARALYSSTSRTAQTSSLFSVSFLVKCRSVLLIDWPG